MIRHTHTWLAAGLLIAGAVGGSAQAASFLAASADFDSPPFLGAGVVAGTLGSSGSFGTANGTHPGSDGKSWSGNFFRNNRAGNPAHESGFELTNLPTHASVDIDFILGFLGEWIGFDSPNGANNLDIFVDGTQIARLTSNQSGGTTFEYGGGTVLATGQLDEINIGSDVIVDMANAPFLSFAHSASTLNFTVQASGAGWQGGDNESWGIDALSIRLQDAVPVPAPESGSLGALAGVGLLVSVLRRRGL